MYWWFTPIQVENYLRQNGLCEADYVVSLYGNLFARVAYQLNLAAEEFTDRERDFGDEGHPLLICVRVVKPFDWKAPKPVYRTPWKPMVTPDKWNPVRGHYPLQE